MGLREFNFERERSVLNETTRQKYWRWTREAADLAWHSPPLIVSILIVTVKEKINGNPKDQRSAL